MLLCGCHFVSLSRSSTSPSLADELLQFRHVGVLLQPDHRPSQRTTWHSRRTAAELLGVLLRVERDAAGFRPGHRLAGSNTSRVARSVGDARILNFFYGRRGQARQERLSDVLRPRHAAGAREVQDPRITDGTSNTGWCSGRRVGDLTKPAASVRLEEGPQKLGARSTAVPRLLCDGSVIRLKKDPDVAN